MLPSPAMETAQPRAPEGAGTASRPRPAPRPVGRAELLILLAIVLAAGAIRVAYLLEIRHTPELRVPPVDSGFSLYWARGLATGDWTLPPQARGRDPLIRDSAYLRPPGYPFVLAGMYRLTGGDPLALRAVQMAGGLAGVVLAWLLGRRLLSPAVGLTWALLLGVHWAPVYFEGGLHGMWLVVALLLILLLLMHRLVRTPSMAAAAAAGAVFGGLVLVRPNVLVTAPLLAAWWVWVAVRRRRGRAAALHAAAAVLAAGLVVAPAVVRNLRVAGTLTPVSANGGITLWAGTNPAATGVSSSRVADLGTFTSPWQMADLVRRLEQETGRELRFAEASRLLGRRAIRWALDNPGDAASLTLRKAALFWGPHEIAHNRAPAAERAASPLLRRLPMGFALALAGGLVGAVLLTTRPVRLAMPDGGPETAVAAALLVLGWFASFLPFFVTSLFRLPVIPFLLLGWSALAVHVVRLALRRRLLPAAAWVAIAVALWVVVRIPLVEVDPGIDKMHVTRGNAWMHLGQPGPAEAEFRAALGARTGSWQAHNGLGAVLLETGRIAEAERHFVEAVRLEPGLTVARANLGLAFARRGAWAPAADMFRSVVEDEPGNADAWANLGVSLEILGRPHEAVEAYGGALEAAPVHPLAANNLAWLLSTSPDETVRDGERAVSIAERLVASAATAATLDTLAAAHAEAGDLERAAATAERALEAARDDPALAADVAARLETFRSGRPYRDRPAGG